MSASAHFTITGMEAMQAARRLVSVLESAPSGLPSNDEGSSFDDFISCSSELYTFNDDVYSLLFQLTLQKRFMVWNELGDDAASVDCKVRTLLILRTLMRSGAITASLASNKPAVTQIFELFERIGREQTHLPECEQLVHLTRIVLHLAQNPHTLPIFVEFNQRGNANAEMLLFLLKTKNYHVLLSSLRALLEIAQSDDTVGVLSRLLQEQSLHALLEIIKDFPADDHRLYAVRLLHKLALDLGPGNASSQARREAIQRTRVLLLQQDANSVLVNFLGELFTDGVEPNAIEIETALSVLYLLHEQAGDVDSACNIRQCNGLSIMLKLMEPQIGAEPDCLVEFPMEIPVLIAVCVTLARLAWTDVSNGLLICNGNGVSSLGLMLTQHSRSGDPQIQELHGHALTTMRILFCLEKNRKVFRRVFPPHIFDQFIDRGQYNGTHARFFEVAELIKELSPEKEYIMRRQLAFMRTRPSPEIQRNIRGYDLEEEIGKGAFGSVFRARSHRSMEQECAIKEFKIESLPSGSGNPDDDLSWEVSILSRLKHPNIVQYEDAFTEGDSVYIVTELVRGTTLLDHINAASEKRESIPENKVWDIFFEICMALLYIHKKRNIIHRDLTPSNIMLDFNGCVKIIDFGLARLVRPNESLVASVVGTLHYSCPELIQHQPYTDKADIWSLGVILYQMCCLLNPFADPNPLLCAKKIVEGTYDQGRLHAHSLELRSMISRLLQPKAEDRPDIVNVLASFPPQRMVCMKLESLYIHNDHLKRRESEHNKKVEELQFKLAQKDQELRRACAAPSRSQLAPGTPDTFGGGFSGPFSSSAPFERIKVRNVKEVDPTSSMLNQVHKLVAISQLPPDIGLHARVASDRTVVEQYKRHIFGGSGGQSLKEELMKLSRRVTERIPFSLGQDMTYEEMHRLIESVYRDTISR